MNVSEQLAVFLVTVDWMYSVIPLLTCLFCHFYYVCCHHHHQLQCQNAVTINSNNSSSIEYSDLAMCIFYLLTSFSLRFNELSLLRLALDVVD